MSNERGCKPSAGPRRAPKGRSLTHDIPPPTVTTPPSAEGDERGPEQTGSGRSEPRCRSCPCRDRPLRTCGHGRFVGSKVCGETALIDFFSGWSSCRFAGDSPIGRAVPVDGDDISPLQVLPGSPGSFLGATGATYCRNGSDQPGPTEKKTYGRFALANRITTAYRLRLCFARGPA